MYAHVQRVRVGGECKFCREEISSGIIEVRATDDTSRRKITQLCDDCFWSLKQEMERFDIQDAKDAAAEQIK